MDNYGYCAAWASGFNRVLDFGCGTGKTVRALREAGVDAWGFDIHDRVAPELAPYVKITNGPLPFPNESFDAITSNFVFEHVKDLNSALGDIARVLRPGGQLLALFPTRGVLIDGHVMLPFVHWFRPNSRIRPYFATAMHAAGIGSNWPGQGLAQYGKEVGRFIDAKTCYRTRREILNLYARYFSRIEHIETDWVSARRNSSRVHRAVSLLPTAMWPAAARSLLGCAVVATK